jgi:pilus assembly protein CpaC
MGGGCVSGQSRVGRRAVSMVALGAALTMFNPVDPATAQDRRSSPTGSVFVTEAAEVQRVKVTLNKSRTFRVDTPFATIVAGSADIVDVKSLSDQLIYIQGKQTGTTNVILLDASLKQIGIIDVEVTIDTSNLQQNIRASTGTNGIRVSSSEGQVVLSGTASDAIAAERAMAIASGTIPKGGVIVNAMSVAAPQQVMLEVRFLEVNRNAGRELGVNWAASIGGRQIINTGRGSASRNPNLGVTTRTQSSSASINNTTTNGVPENVVNNQVSDSATTTSGNREVAIPLLSTAGTLVGGSLGGPFGAILANVVSNGGTNVDVLVTALEEKGVVRRLAEPNLVALSGDAARFLAGGEFPVPVGVDNSNQIRIEFKKFGVELAFVPTVLSRGTINLRVEPSVSELDFTNAVTLSGVQIPALTARNARTTVELRDGQSFAVAGLLQTRNRQQVAQLPWIGSVPVLGALFRSSSFQQEETDLVIIVTPRLVAPAIPGQKLASPLDARLPPNDVDFFVNGQMEVRKRYNDYVNSGGELKGPYGHIIAPEARARVTAPAVSGQPALK